MLPPAKYYPQYWCLNSDKNFAQRLYTVQHGSAVPSMEQKGKGRKEEREKGMEWDAEEGRKGKREVREREGRPTPLVRVRVRVVVRVYAQFCVYNIGLK